MNLLSDFKSFIFILLGFSIPISVGFTNVLIILFLVLWIIEGRFFEKFFSFKSSNWMCSLVVLVFIYLLSFFHSDNHDDSLYVFKRLALLLFFIPLVTSKFSQLTFKYAVLAFLLTNLLSAILAIGINYDIIQPIKDISSNNYSPISAFLSYNYHNILLSFSSLLSFSVFTKSKSKYSFIYLILIVIYAASIFSEAGRAGQLTFVVFFIVYAFYFLIKRIFYSISILIFLIIITFSSYKNSEIFKQRVDNLSQVVQNNGVIKSEKSSKKNIRYIFLDESIDLILKNPFLGYGIGSFSSVFIQNTTSDHLLIYPNYDHKTPHNNYLYVFFELGFFGFFIFILIFYFQIKDLITLRLFKFERALLPLFMVFLMLFDSYLFIFTITVFYMFMYTIYSGYKIED